MKSSKCKKLWYSIVTVAALFMSQTSYAVSVLPGDTTLLGGTTFAANPDLGGTVIRDVLIPFSISDGLGNVLITGNVQDRVARSINTGELIFAPRLRDLVNPTGVAWIMGLSTTGYTGFSTDIDFRTDSLGDVGANGVTRDAVGDSLLFRYDPNLIVPTDEALFLSVFTDATDFDLSGSITIFAQNDFGADIFSTTLLGTAAPSTVPVPAAVWLFGSGLIGMVGLARRKAK